MSTQMNNTNDKNIKTCELFSDLVCESITRDNVVDLNKLDELYSKLKKIIEDKNININEWYDKTYHSNVFDLNIKMNKFAKLAIKTSDDIFTISY